MLKEVDAIGLRIRRAGSCIHSVIYSLLQSANRLPLTDVS